MGVLTKHLREHREAMQQEQAADDAKNPAFWRCRTHGPAKSGAWGCPDCVRELRDENTRLYRALQWLEDKARARKLEIAPSLLGTGFEFGFWPTGDARVVNATTLLEAVEAAQRA